MTDSPTVERLCQHHDITQFNCPESEFEATLTRFHGDTNVGVLSRTYATVLDTRVVGYVAVSDVRIRRQERFFYISHLAVSLERRGTRDFLRLLLRAIEIREALEAVGKHYDGDAVTPGSDLRLARLARAAGFRRLKGSSLWIRIDPTPSRQP